MHSAARITASTSQGLRARAVRGDDGRSDSLAGRAVDPERVLEGLELRGVVSVLMTSF
jgi:hypothetical protein